MKLLFVINQPPGSAQFAEAITALLGVSLFGQATGALLLGGSDKDTPAAAVDNQLNEILELGLAKVFAPSEFQPLLGQTQLTNHPSIEFIDNSEIAELIHNAESVVSF